jgi:hypothetical protein
MFLGCNAPAKVQIGPKPDNAHIDNREYTICIKQPLFSLFVNHGPTLRGNPNIQISAFSVGSMRENSRYESIRGFEPFVDFGCGSESGLLHMHRYIHGFEKGSDDCV